ncbi:hypothetical protein J6590_038529 [Homalodisca vitripennis]|nr:hypothetical protein J6590_038529 [Homalodisca vitripennis]
MIRTAWPSRGRPRSDPHNLLPDRATARPSAAEVGGAAPRGGGGMIIFGLRAILRRNSGRFPSRHPLRVVTTYTD